MERNTIKTPDAQRVRRWKCDRVAHNLNVAGQHDTASSADECTCGRSCQVSIETSGFEIIQECHCLDCDLKWTNVYSLYCTVER